MKKNYFLNATFIAFFVMLSACSGEADELSSSFVGYWKLLDSPKNSVLRIYRDGDHYFADMNVLSDKAPDGSSKIPARLIIIDEGFDIDSPFISGNILFSGSDDRIIVGNRFSYVRISEDDLLKAKDITSNCDQLRQNYLKEMEAIPLGYDHSKKLSELKKKYNQSIKSIKDCKPL